jgi:hypothetical protein
MFCHTWSCFATPGHVSSSLVLFCHTWSCFAILDLVLSHLVMFCHIRCDILGHVIPPWLGFVISGDISIHVLHLVMFCHIWKYVDKPGYSFKPCRVFKIKQDLLEQDPKLRKREELKQCNKVYTIYIMWLKLYYDFQAISRTAFAFKKVVLSWLLRIFFRLAFVGVVVWLVSIATDYWVIVVGKNIFLNPKL